VKTVEQAPEVNNDKIKSIVDGYGDDRSSLISILLDIQNEFNYLPKEALNYISERLCISLIQIYSIATYYKAFSLVPRGKHVLTVCLGTACHVRNAVIILEEIQRELGICPGETTEDMEFSLETVNCLGACALGPIVVADGVYHGKMMTARVKKLIFNIKSDKK